MDINKIAGLVQAAKPTRRVKVENDKTFAEVLDKTLNEVHEKECPSGVPLPCSGVFSMTSVEAANVDHSTIRQASNVLDLMETYASALQDPKRTLKSIEPIVRQIREEIQGLKIQARGQDEELLKLVDQITVTATVETLKFHRGDYLA